MKFAVVVTLLILCVSVIETSRSEFRRHSYYGPSTSKGQGGSVFKQHSYRGSKRPGRPSSDDETRQKRQKTKDETEEQLEEWRYRCSPIDAYNRHGRQPHSITTLYPNSESIEIEPDSGERDLVYEKAEYPQINNGVLPPTLPRSSTIQYVAHTFYAHLSSRRRAEPPINFIRLPYLFPSGLRLDCKVHNQSGFRHRFFVLERFDDKEVVRIDILTSRRREYVYLPYFDTEDGQTILYTRQTWIVKTYQERPIEPFPRYGYLHVSENDVAQHRIPLNAYEAFIYTRPYYTTDQVTEKISRAELSVNWMPAMCTVAIKNAKWVVREKCNMRWTIHALWGTPMEVNINNAHMPVLENAQLDVPNLEENWFSVDVGNNTLYLSRHWNKHGRHLFEQPIDYITKTMQLFTALDINSKMNTLMIPEDTSIFDFDHSSQSIDASFGYNVELRCEPMTSYGFNLFYEMRFCYKIEANEYILENCAITDEQKRHCREWMFYPKTMHVFPYLTLTVYWLPSQLARLRGFTTKNPTRATGVTLKVKSEPGWKVRGLCAANHYYYVERGYKDYMKYIDTRFGRDLLRELQIFRANMPQITTQGEYMHYRYGACGFSLRLLDIPSLRGPFNYCNQSVFKFYAVHANQWPPHRMQTDTRIDTNVVRQRIVDVVKKNVSLQCFTNRHGARILVKVRVCYNTDAEITLIDCPASDEIFVRPQPYDYRAPLEKGQRYENTECGDQLWIPSTDEQALNLGRGGNV